MTSRIAHLIPVIVLTAGVAACDKVPLFAPSQSTITLTAPKRILSLNESIEVTAVVLEQGGTPVQNGTSVRFTSTLGRVSPVEVETRNGIAVATFSAGDISGVADVSATSGAAGGAAGSGNAGGTGGAASSTATNVIQFTIGAAAAETISIRANPSTVGPNGGSVDVIATILGKTGQPIPGVPVSFSATRGTLTPGSATTDASGNATVRLTTNAETVVTATGGGKTTATGVTIAVQGTPGVTLTCSGTAAAAASCSQIAGQSVSFTVARAATTTQIIDSTLEFGDGITMGFGTLSNPSTVTHTYDRAGTYTATLRAVDVNGQRTTASVSVTITNRTPLAVNVSAASGVATVSGQRWEFTATVTPAADVPLVESYTWDFGDGETATTSGDKTAHVYTDEARRTITVTVRTTDGRTGTGRTEIIIDLP